MVQYLQKQVASNHGVVTVDDVLFKSRLSICLSVADSIAGHISGLALAELSIR